MPLIIITTSQPNSSDSISKMISDIRMKSANALQCSIDNIWVIYQPVESYHYVQKQDSFKNSPIVIIKAQSGRSHEQKTALAEAITKAISKGLDVPARPSSPN